MTCKIVPEMTYNVSSGTLSLYTTTDINLKSLYLLLVISYQLTSRPSTYMQYTKN